VKKGRKPTNFGRQKMKENPNPHKTRF